jgi:hypothetical protein
VSFVQADADGFGDPDSLGPNPVRIEYGDHQYHEGRTA